MAYGYQLLLKPFIEVLPLSPSDYTEGEIILYRRYSGFNFNVYENEYLCIEAGDILVKLLEDAPKTDKGETN